MSSRQAPDPLAGWHGGSLDDIPPQVSADYKEYINKLPAEERDLVGSVFFYGDDAGHLAIQFEIAKHGTLKEHILIYDSAYKRIKIVRYNGRYGM
jgi:hypothetical protein